jgi:hypothetical protein
MREFFSEKYEFRSTFERKSHMQTKKRTIFNARESASKTEQTTHNNNNNNNNNTA